MGQSVSRTEFYEDYKEEPHATRRKEILKKHPEIKRLFGADRWLAAKLMAVVAVQCLVAALAVDLPWGMFWLVTYVVSGTLNHSLLLGLHELAHNLAFGQNRLLANRLLSLAANLPTGIPSAIAFKYYHLDHHKFLGDPELDMDVPTQLEGRLFATTAGKVLWVFLQPLFYALRPVIMRPKPPSRMELLNLATCLTFNFTVWYLLGYKGLLYMIGGTFLGMGLHPVAGHFIAEHYMFTKGQETYSYYGPMNVFCHNVGYHNEHHDFPFVPGSRLPQIRAMAPEFYDTLPTHSSWLAVIYQFITDPAIGTFSRVTRDVHALRRRAKEANEAKEGEKMGVGEKPAQTQTQTQAQAHAQPQAQSDTRALKEE